MAKWSSPSAFRACPQLTQGPNLWSFLFPSLQDCTSSVKLVGDPSEPSWFSSASQNLVREGQGRCIFPWVTLAPPGSKQGTNSQSFDKSGCRNWRQEDKEGPFFFFFSWLIPMALYQLRSLQTLGSSQMGQHGKVSSASTAWSVRNASYEPFSRVCSLKSHYLALKEW